MLKDLLNFNTLGGRYAAFCRDLKGNKSIAINSPTKSEKLHFAAFNPYFTLYITPDRLSARETEFRINEFLGQDRAVTLPEREDILLHRHISGQEIVYERMNAIKELVKGNVKALVAPVEALMQYYPRKELAAKLIITVRKGGVIDLSDFISRLVKASYRREERVTDKGSFSVRGDIIEIFPVGYELPVRISLFDETVEYIRIFEPESMLSTGEYDEITIAPATDIIIGDGAVKSALDRVKRVFQSDGARRRTDEIISDIESISALHPSSSSLVWLLPYLEEYLSTIFDYLPADTLIIYDEPKLIEEKARLIEKEHNSRLDRLISEGECLEAHRNSLIPRDKIFELSRAYKTVSYKLFKAVNRIAEPDVSYEFKGRNVSSYYLDFKLLVRDITVSLYKGIRVVICAADKTRAESLILNLFSEGLSAGYYEDLPADFSGLAVISERLSHGMVLDENRLVILGTWDVFRKTEKRIRSKKRSLIEMPKKGDYVVHETHGIGKCEGIVTLKSKYDTKDYVLVIYRDNDKLYVPVEQLDMLERYSGGEKEPSLSKIGGREFEKIKDNVKKSVKKLAIDLIEIYGRREKADGVKYPPDTPWQKEFEESFPYDETADQLEAVKDIKSDMEAGKVMDRLICGDVGYGKTEVALRAIFKTVMGGRQAAVLAPTTILAEQHYITATERFKPFGIKCAALTRFVTKDKIKNSLNELKTGGIDVVIATHRLLSKDVQFNNLGLLVLDEEQRFGVEHKEKIKALKANINVLTLTATPIPRTLNMALTGVRDISLLETPPVGRLPVATYVTELNDALIIDAVKRELGRGGQVLILYNNVATIEMFAARVKKLIEDATVEIAHGQMPDSALEKVIGRIYDKKADILISSTIIENGIDLPDANTLIVVDADKLGLTELYQLRGRVGRRDRLAYAYFTVREGKILTSDAVKRLEALTEYTEFGSGFKIAMKDLEIRGAGNILGREQHGHINKVGYDMYIKLLDEAVRELKGEAVIKPRDVEVSIRIDAYLSDELSGGHENKMRIYKRIAAIKSLDDRDRLREELADIVKHIDVPLINLIDISLIRALAGGIGVNKVIINESATSLIFNDSAHIKAENALYAISKMHDRILINNSFPPSVNFNFKGLTVREKMDEIIRFLKTAQGIY